MSKHLMNTYAPLPLAMSHGEGAWLYDTEGRRYLDLISGIGVTSLGHAHPAVTEAICEQAGRLLHTANLVQIPWQQQLADQLAEVSGLPRAFIANSGAEAVECAIKLCRLQGQARGLPLARIVVMEQSFHGRTLATLSATGSKKVQAGYAPLVDGFIRVPFGDLDAIKALAGQEDIVAVLLEPIQGESGVRVPPEGYLRGVRELCDTQGWLLACDEIQTGLCRTGHWYACQGEGVLPDIITSAKALGNGMPVAACLASEEVANLFHPGAHGSTFGGNPLACRTACAVLSVMADEQLAQRAAELGRMALEGFRQKLAGHAGVADIRGRGLMLGIECRDDVNHLRQAAVDRGLLLNVTHDRVIRMLPPLIMDQEQVEMMVEGVSGLLLDAG